MLQNFFDIILLQFLLKNFSLRITSVYIHDHKLEPPKVGKHQKVSWNFCDELALITPISREIQDEVCVCDSYKIKQ